MRIGNGRDARQLLPGPGRLKTSKETEPRPVRIKLEYSRTSLARLGQDLTRFCHSCDICQVTVKQGSVEKVPLVPMPLIDMPFKKVAVDIVRPIAPPE